MEVVFLLVHPERSDIPGSPVALDLAWLRATVRGRVILPEDGAYEAARQVWNRAYDRRPVVVVVCEGVSDVMAAVRYAAAQHLPVSVRSGGHHVAGMGAGDGAVMLDLRAMRTVLVDPARETAIVQGGAVAADVIRETQAFGLAVPTGDASTVGMAALALGGGMGYLRRQHGLTCDHLIGADMVLADGTFAHVSADRHPELFWALRGGGGNFGVATALYFRLQRVGPAVMGIRLMYPAEDAPAVLRGCREFLAANPEVTLNIALMQVPDRPGAPPPLVGRRLLYVHGLHPSGDLAQAAKAIRPLRELATPFVDLSGPTDYLTQHTALDTMIPPFHTGYADSIYVRDLSDELLDTLLEHAAAARPGNVMVVWPLGGRMAEVAPDATAFGDRGAGALVMIESTWEDATGRPAGVEWVQAVQRDLIPHHYNGGTYLNLTGSQHPDYARIAATYGDNWGRLQAIKRQYDPDNRFRFNANIHPELEVPRA